MSEYDEFEFEDRAKYKARSNYAPSNKSNLIYEIIKNVCLYKDTKAHKGYFDRDNSGIDPDEIARRYELPLVHVAAAIKRLYSEGYLKLAEFEVGEIVKHKRMRLIKREDGKWYQYYPDWELKHIYDGRKLQLKIGYWGRPYVSRKVKNRDKRHFEKWKIKFIERLKPINWNGIQYETNDDSQVYKNYIKEREEEEKSKEEEKDTKPESNDPRCPICGSGFDLK